MAWKIVFCFLILPISAVGQDSSPPGQSAPSTQSSTEAQDSASVPDAMIPSISTPILPPVPLQPQPPVSLRPIRQPPLAPGYAPLFNLSAGYSVASLGMPSAGRVALSGVNVGISGDSGKPFAAKLDFDYARASNVFQSGHGVHVLSYLVGPVFFPWRGNFLTTDVHLLVGGARVTGPFRNATGGLSVGYVHYPAWEFGGGVEYRLSAAFGFRVSIDYLHTHFYNTSGVVRGQNDLRVVNSIVYYLGTPTIKRRR